MTVGWQPIETAPKDGDRVLLFDEDDGRAVIGRWDENWNAWRRGFLPDKLLDSIYMPINWMPLPEDPY